MSFHEKVWLVTGAGRGLAHRALSASLATQLQET